MFMDLVCPEIVGKTIGGLVFCEFAEVALTRSSFALEGFGDGCAFTKCLYQVCYPV
jgi:hypothetical protein